MHLETISHIKEVTDLISKIITELVDRAVNHDDSKLRTPEVEIFDKFTPLLKSSTYGSEEYYSMLSEMKIAINHHYSENRHHPEFHKNGIKGMNLIDLLEMFCDWKAATMRHDNGDILESIKINKGRFGYSDELESIFNNTAKWINTIPEET